MKTNFRNMPLEVSLSEYMVLAKTLYASLNAMLSNNEMIYFIDTETRKVYGFDSIKEIEHVNQYAAMKTVHLLQILR